MAFGLSAEAMQSIQGLGIDLGKSANNSIQSDGTVIERAPGNPSPRGEAAFDDTPIEINPIEPEDAVPEDQLENPAAIEQDIPKPEDLPEESPLKEAAEAEDSEERDTPKEDIEWIKADGKKIKVDHNDRARNKKAHELAAGFRGLTSKFDNVTKEFGEYKESMAKKSQVLDILNEHKDDPAELVRLISGGKLDLEEWRKAKNSEEEAIASMTEDEFTAYQKQIHDRQKDTKIQELEDRLESMEQAGVTSSAEAETSRKNDLLSTTFKRFMFRGKLEDTISAETMDEMMWHSFNKSMKDNHDEWTPEAAEFEMKLIHDRVSRAFNREVEKKVDTVVKREVQTAKQKIAAAVAPSRLRSRDDLLADTKEKGISGMLANLGNYQF